MSSVSLSRAMFTALSALKTGQAALGYTSQNIANTNTEGYSRQVVSQQSKIIAGNGVGVELAAITRTVDTFLINELRVQTSTLGSSEAKEVFYGFIMDMFGTLAGESAIATDITDLFSSLDSLANTPENAATRLGVVNSAVEFARQISAQAQRIQDVRKQADSEIAFAVTTIANEAKRISDLNDAISKGTVTAQTTTEMEDRRDMAIMKIADYLDITYFEFGNNQTAVSTGNGRTLIQYDPATFTYSPAATVAYSTVFNPISLGGVDITSEISSGRLKSLIEMRDTILPNLASQLDTLVNTLRDQINAVHNDGVGFPAANTLSGNVAGGIAGTDAFAGTGSVRIAVVDAAGDSVGVPLDLNLVGLATVTDVIGAINAGLAGNGTASIVNSQLVITATVGTNGIAINEMTSSVGASTQGLSDYFGLNDLFLGTRAVNLAVRSDIVTSPSLISSGELGTGAIASGATAITFGDNRVAIRLAQMSDTLYQFAATGGLPLTQSTLADYAGSIMAQHATSAADLTDQIISDRLVVENLSQRAQSVAGVNIDEEMANLIQFQNAYGAAARVFSTTQDMFDTLLSLGR